MQLRNRKLVCPKCDAEYMELEVGEVWSTRHACFIYHFCSKCSFVGRMDVLAPDIRKGTKVLHDWDKINYLLIKRTEERAEAKLPGINRALDSIEVNIYYAKNSIHAGGQASAADSLRSLEESFSNLKRCVNTRPVFTEPDIPEKALIRDLTYTCVCGYTSSELDWHIVWSNKLKGATGYVCPSCHRYSVDSLLRNALEISKLDKVTPLSLLQKIKYSVERKREKDERDRRLRTSIRQARNRLGKLKAASFYIKEFMNDSLHEGDFTSRSGCAPIGKAMAKLVEELSERIVKTEEVLNGR